MGTSRPARDRITDLALAMLEDALARAEHGPVERHHGHRLALAWMAHIGVAQDWQCVDFWREMASEDRSQISTDYARYCRTGRMTGLLDNWYRALGKACPSMVERGEKVRAVIARKENATSPAFPPDPPAVIP